MPVPPPSVLWRQTVGWGPNTEGLPGLLAHIVGEVPHEDVPGGHPGGPCGKERRAQTGRVWVATFG